MSIALIALIAYVLVNIVALFERLKPRGSYGYRLLCFAFEVVFLVLIAKAIF